MTAKGSLKSVEVGVVCVVAVVIAAIVVVDVNQTKLNAETNQVSVFSSELGRFSSARVSYYRRCVVHLPPVQLVLLVDFCFQMHSTHQQFFALSISAAAPSVDLDGCLNERCRKSPPRRRAWWPRHKICSFGTSRILYRIKRRSFCRGM